MLVVVGGHSRNIGKTSVVAGLIRALPQANWTALKITQFGHGVCAAAGHACDCATAPEHPYAIEQELAPSKTDSGRFLAAGARRSFWVRTRQGHLAPALPALRRIFETSENVIAESNSLVQFVQPDLYLAVLDFSQRDFKPSALKYLDRASAVITVARNAGSPGWKDVSPSLWAAKPRFEVQLPSYVNEELAEFVRSRVFSTADAKVDSCVDREAS